MVTHYHTDLIRGPVYAQYFQQSHFTRLILLDSLLPAREWRDIINYCSSRTQLIIACSASAHHIIWWITNANLREGLVEYLIHSNLTVYQPR
jgi:response regulator of citrate/malate metabolism